MRLFSTCLILLTKFVFITYGAMLPHQGRVLISGSAFEGTGLFRFALVDQSGAVVWNHQGTYGEPETDIAIDLAKGFYQCRLGDTSIDGMAELPTSIFVPDYPLKLRIWFNDGVNGLKRLGQDQNLMMAPYAMTECGDPTGALQLLHDSSNRFGEDAQYIFALGRQYALLCDIEESKKYVKRAIKMDSSLKAEFLDDPAFDAVWESF